MKRLTTLLLLLCCLPFMAMAQDLNPGQQSQGLLESRNVTVDYSTGIFHYQIPLYTLKSGDYELPISLRYTGKGVKVSDNPGLVGYNWTLDTGGIVTRTVRGGIPDEKEYVGYIHHEKDMTPLWEDTLRVNQRLRDGESDIFTARFGNQSVNFIIRKVGNEIYAETLERTDVKIICETYNEQCNSIRGWIITDANGNRYIYRSKEWTVDLNRQEESGFNAISNMDYVSSWYPTCIEPLNGKAINFHYSCGDTDKFCDTYYNVATYEDIYYMKFEYGMDMEVPIFDFNTFKEEFNSYIEAALYGISDYNALLSCQYEIESQYQSSIQKLGMTTSPTLEYINNEKIQNDNIFGYATGFSYVSSHVSEGLLTTLLNLETMYSDKSPSASYNFARAAELVERCMLGLTRELKSMNYGEAGIYCKVYTPVLKSIVCHEKISFTHQDSNKRLLDVKRKGMSDALLSSFQLSYNQDRSLSSVTFKDKNDGNVKTTSFCYYELQEGETVMSDMYGYKKRGDSTRDEFFMMDIHEEYSKIGSLEKILFADGGHLHIDYEQNEYLDKSEVKPYGGIRIRSLALYDSSKEYTDSICYEYEPGTIPVFDGPYYVKEKKYTGFSDWIQYSRMLIDSNTILCPGNNGLYYNCVKEILSDNGSCVYYFCSPSTFSGDKYYAYRFYGLPLLTIDFDISGKAIHAVQNLYYTDFMKESGTPFHLLCKDPENFTHLDELVYSGNLQQSILNEDYMNTEMMENYYRNITNSPYNPSYRFFQQNILPRALDRYETTNYTLRYGGATLLKEQREFHAEREYMDYRKLLEEQEPDKRTVYHYDNLDKHTRPGRIVTYTSQRDSIVKYYVYADDMESSVDKNIADMQRCNVLSPVIKEGVIRNEVVQTKSVTEYDFKEKENRFYCLPTRYSIYIGKDTTTYFPNPTMLYDGATDEYMTCKKFEGNFVTDETLAPICIFEEGKHTGYIYDNFTGRHLLCIPDSTISSFAAADVHLQSQSSNETYDMMRILELSKLFWQGFLNLDRNLIEDSEYQSYSQSEEFREGGIFMELLYLGEKGTWKRELLDNALASLDSISDYEEFPVCQFVDKHLELCRNWQESEMEFPWDMTMDEMQELRDALYMAVYVHYGNPLRLHLLSFIEEGPTLFCYIPQTALPQLGINRYKLYLLSTDTTGSVNYKITHNNGTSYKKATFTGVNSDSIYTVDIDLSEYDRVTGITITHFSGIRYFALLPEDSEFDATSYNEDGTVSFKFNQNGQMQHHEYDSAGRLICVRDENGKTIETNDYQVKINTF